MTKRNSTKRRNTNRRLALETLETREVFSNIALLSVAAPDLNLAPAASAEATEAVIGESVSSEVAQGTINYGRDADWFRFNAAAGQQYTIRTVLGSLHDSKISLHDSSGNRVAFNDDANGTLASQIDFKAPRDGVYSVKVEAYGSLQTGSYMLQVSQPAAAYQIQSDISRSSEVDRFALTAEAGKTYNIETTLGSLADTTLTLVGPNGRTRLAFNDDGGEGLASRIVWTAPSNGMYFIDVAAYGSWQTGSYDLTISDTAVVQSGQLRGDWNVESHLFSDPAGLMSYIPIPPPRAGDNVSYIPIPPPRTSGTVTHIPISAIQSASTHRLDLVQIDSAASALNRGSNVAVIIPIPPPQSTVSASSRIDRLFEQRTVQQTDLLNSLFADLSWLN